MVKRSVSVRLHDILAAIDEVQEYLERPDFAYYKANPIVQRAVERCIEIVSEATRHIPAALTDEFPSVPWSAIKAIGNVLRHDYQRVEDHVAWRTATQSFRELRPIIVEMLSKVGDQ